MKIKKTENYLLIISLLFVVIVKFPHLSIPYFWDEAWSYFPAVYEMYKNGPGLLPGALPIWESKGHPLFFFFLASLWMRVAGTSVFWVHVLPLLISVATLITTFFVVKKHANLWAANIAVLLISIQALFLAQASFLLPEMLITLLLLLSINAYLSKKYWWFAIVASVMVMTKETTLVFAGGFLLFHLMSKQDTKPKKFNPPYLQLILPLVVYGIFLLLHKKEFGTFFFHEHTDNIQLSFATITKKLKVAAGVIFTRYGRNIILLAAVSALTVLIFRGKKPENQQLLRLLVLQVIIFLLFSSLNFYTHRYMLCLLFLFIIIASVLLVQVRFGKPKINAMVIAILVAFPLFYTFTKKSNSDSDLSYVYEAKVLLKMVRFCEEQEWHNEPVAASFNLLFCLRNQHLGYLSTEKPFSNVMDLGNLEKAEIILNECTSSVSETELDSVLNRYKLVKEFKLEHAWGKIYTKIPIKRVSSTEFSDSIRNTKL